MTNNNDFNEVEMIRLTRLGNEQAFTAIFDHYHPKIMNAALFILKDHDLAAQVVEEVFYSVWENRSEIEEIDFEASLYTLSKGIVYSKFTKALEQRKGKQKVVKDNSILKLHYHNTNFN